MTKTKKICFAALISLLMLCLSVSLAACGNKTTETVSDFEIKESVTVFQGAVVHTETPFIVNNFGQKLGFDVRVEDKDGVSVELVNGTFVAEKESYTIYYDAILSVGGKVTKTTAVTVILPDTRLESYDKVTDANLYLADRKAEYDFSEHFTTDVSEIKDDYDFIYELDGEEMNGSVLPADAAIGIGKVTVYARNKSTGTGKLLYEGRADVYDSTEPSMTVAKPEITQMRAYAANTWNGHPTSNFAEDSEKGAVLSVAGSAVDQVGVAINAIHGAEYYEMLAESNDKLYAVYSFKFLSEGSDITYSYRHYNLMTGTDTMSENTRASLDEWISVSVPLAEFAGYTETLRTVYTQNFSSSKGYTSKGFLMKYNTVLGSQTRKTAFYMTDVKLYEIASLDLDSVTDTTVHLVEKSDSYDLSALYTEDTESYKTDFDFVWSIDGKEITGSIVPQTIEHGLHGVVMRAKNKASGAETELYTGTIDFYDEENPDFTVATATEKYMYGVTSSGSLTNESTQTTYENDYDGRGNVIKVTMSAAANYSGIVLNSLHGSAYYEKLAINSSYYLEFEFKVESQEANPAYQVISNVSGNMGDRKSYTKGTWQSVRMSLGEFAEYTEVLRKKYNDNLSIKGTSNKTEGGATSDFLRITATENGINGSGNGKAATVYMTEIKIVELVATASADCMYGLTSSASGKNLSTQTSYIGAYDCRADVMQVNMNEAANYSGAVIKPLQNKTYYQSLANGAENYFVTFEFKVESAEAVPEYQIMSAVDGTMSARTSCVKGEWKTVEIPLGQFVEFYDTWVKKYDDNINVKGKDVVTAGGAKSDFLRITATEQANGGGNGKAATFYITSVKLIQKAQA